MTMDAIATRTIPNRYTLHPAQAITVGLKTTRYLRIAAPQKTAQNRAMDNEKNIRDLLRMARRIAQEELDTDNVTAVLAVFERLCLERDHERFLQAHLPSLTKH